jgi:death on curing protein
MRYLTKAEILKIHHQIITETGGSFGVSNLGLLESAIAQPQMTFDGEELYPNLTEKAATLGFCLIKNHPFIDGNKRTGHAAMEVFLILNGYEINASIDEQEKIILQVASSELNRDNFTKWLSSKIILLNETV